MPDSTTVASSMKHPPVGVLHSLLRTWATKWNLNSASSLLTLIAFAFGTLRWMHSSTTQVVDLIFDHATTRVAIPGGNEMNGFVEEWVNRHVLPNRRNKLYKLRKAAKSKLEDTTINHTHSTAKAPGEEEDCECRGEESRAAFECIPQFSTIWFFHDRRLFTIKRGRVTEKKRDDSSDDDDEDDEDEREPLLIACLGSSKLPIIKFLKTCEREAKTYSKKQPQMRIYLQRSYSKYWYFHCKLPARPLRTIHLDEKVLKDLVMDIEQYLSPSTRLRYAERSLPWQRGYLFYGPPGTGKSTLASVLAGRYGLSLHVLRLDQLNDDDELEGLFSNLPARSIVLMEDIDAATADRSEEDESAAPKKKKKGRTSSCTLSGVLNALDGIGAQEGRIVIMTTNHIEDLDPALIRPGRIDKKVYLGNISPASAKDMFIRMFESWERDDTSKEKVATESGDINETKLERLASEFTKLVPRDAMTPAELQGFFQLNLDSPEDALAQFDNWLAGWHETAMSKVSTVP
ncbi:P-loop containing nucleoside triphosphate hydrolase protein [Xylariaceae sp. FL1272]|nr:P-loop containing nucleoside triphosphate hydrolase protein [Xylariaceae sp. FL1272]